MNVHPQLTRAASICLGMVFIACSNSQCQPGATQICVGSMGCRGGQICTTDGSQWGACDCGGTGSIDGGSVGDSPFDAAVSGLFGTIQISASNPTPVTPTAFGINYWSWVQSINPNLGKTQAAVAALHPRIMRIGGANNDSNSPNPFDSNQLQRAVNYADAVGAEILWQVPLVADNDGNVPTPDTAAAMVRLANVTNDYGVKYFSIGNEPDLYPDQIASLASFTATDYCTTVATFVSAMKAVDNSIKIVGPDLSWKYQSGAQDWLTPILQQCGAYFDVIAVHRYPFSAAQATMAAAQSDASNFEALVTSIRSKMEATGYGQVPLAITEMNITWDGTPSNSTLDASPGTLPAGLWMADAMGVALTQGLWTANGPTAGRNSLRKVDLVP